MPHVLPAQRARRCVGHSTFMRRAIKPTMVSYDTLASTRPVQRAGRVVGHRLLRGDVCEQMQCDRPTRCRPGHPDRDSSGLGETLGVSSSGAEPGQPSVSPCLCKGQGVTSGFRRLRRDTAPSSGAGGWPATAPSPAWTSRARRWSSTDCAETLSQARELETASCCAFTRPGHKPGDASVLRRLRGDAAPSQCDGPLQRLHPAPDRAGGCVGH